MKVPDPRCRPVALRAGHWVRSAVSASMHLVKRLGHGS
jgi:hypothetical protein